MAFSCNGLVETWVLGTGDLGTWLPAGFMLVPKSGVSQPADPEKAPQEHIWRCLGTLGGCGSTVEGWQPSVLGMDDGAALCHRWEPCLVEGNFMLTAIIQSNN